MNRKLAQIGSIFNHPDLFLKLYNFEELSNGWNGYADSIPLPNKIVNKAAIIMSQILSHEIKVFPTGRNSIQLEWGDFELEITGEYDEAKNNYGISGFIDLPENPIEYLSSNRTVFMNERVDLNP